MEPLHIGASCLGSLLNTDSPDTTGASLIPSTAELLGHLHPEKYARDFLPLWTVLYMGPGGHRQCYWDQCVARSLAKEQTGEEIPLRSMSGHLLPGNPWPKTEEVLDKNNAFAFAKRKKYGYRQEQGNSWDQYGDSSSAA